jgi:integrase
MEPRKYNSVADPAFRVRLAEIADALANLKDADEFIIIVKRDGKGNVALSRSSISFAAGAVKELIEKYKINLNSFESRAVSASGKSQLIEAGESLIESDEADAHSLRSYARRNATLAETSRKFGAALDAILETLAAHQDERIADHLPDIQKLITSI